MIIVGVIWINYILLLIGINDGKCDDNFRSIDDFNENLSIEDRFEKLNSDLKALNHLTAYYAWELSLTPSTELSEQSTKFNEFRTNWINKICFEMESVSLNETQRQMIKILCNGPKFSAEQSNQLCQVLYRMQEIFTETQICLPKHFDVCVNLDQIWDFTYFKAPDGQIYQLDLKDVAPKKSLKSNLNFFDETVDRTYYAFSGNIQKNFASTESIESKIRVGPFRCFDGEPDLDRFMEADFTGLNRPDCAIQFNDVFRWAWESWRMAVGNKIKPLYPKAVDIMNDGAKNNGYNDIGEIWRAETQIPNLNQVMNGLIDAIRPFYKLLHGVLRHVLWKKVHNFESFSNDGTIPAHLLGSMWAQNWKIYQNLIMPFPEVDLDENLMKANWSTIDMVKHSDDFISSMGLPMMTDEFWTNSHFQKDNDLQKCHGTAANMFDENDYRMIVCAERNFNDLYVIIHEMGHIQYYMAFKDQPTIFQDANSALQESIGDALHLGFMTPQHLNRVRLLPDKYLYPANLNKIDQTYLNVIFADEKKKDKHQNLKDLNKDENQSTSEHNNSPKILIFGQPFPDITRKLKEFENYQKFKDQTDRTINAFDLSLLLRMALTKIPQIPFEYNLDTFRWNLFNGNVQMSDANDYFWNLAYQEQGVHPPEWKNRHNYFDAGAKFHVADNTPFVRYFLASFIQAQIFRGLCDVTVYGNVTQGRPLPMPLHRCDIYGSKRAGNLLRKALKIGQSQPWTEVLYKLTGSYEISADALLLYYQPLIRWLEKISIEYDIPIGW